MADEQHDALAILRQIEPLLLRLAEDVAGIKATLPSLATRADVARLDASVPALATKADLASKPNRGELWAAMAAGLALFAIILAGLSYLPPH